MRRQFLPPTFIGILGTALLHAFFIHSAVFGSRGPKRKLPEAPELAFAKSTASSERLVLISLPTFTNPNQVASESPISSLPNLSKLKIKTPILDPSRFLNLETLALSENQAPNPSAGESDGADLARLFGIYTGQIQARINRVWRKPRTSVSEGDAKASAEESFQCEAQIVQDARGFVQEILLPRCNGSAAWQRSLVLAIQQASPLPAPPSVKVFTQSITLRFIGLPYTQGASSEEYEIVPVARASQ